MAKKKTKKRTTSRKKAARRKTPARKKAARRKTPARKKAPHRKPLTKIGVQGGSVQAAGTIKFAEPKQRKSVYDDLYDRLSRLTKGKAYLVPVPKGVSPKVIHNRINAAFRRRDVNATLAPKGCEFVKRTTEHGKIAIVCQKKSR